MLKEILRYDEETNAGFLKEVNDECYGGRLAILELSLYLSGRFWTKLLARKVFRHPVHSHFFMGKHASSIRTPTF